MINIPRIEAPSVILPSMPPERSEEIGGTCLVAKLLGIPREGKADDVPQNKREDRDHAEPPAAIDA